MQNQLYNPLLDPYFINIFSFIRSSIQFQDPRSSFHKKIQIKDPQFQLHSSWLDLYSTIQLLDLIFKQRFNCQIQISTLGSIRYTDSTVRSIFQQFDPILIYRLNCKIHISTVRSTFLQLDPILIYRFNCKIHKLTVRSTFQQWIQF